MVISEQTDDAQGFAFDSHIPIVVGGCGQDDGVPDEAVSTAVCMLSPAPTLMVAPWARLVPRIRLRKSNDRRFHDQVREELFENCSGRIDRDLAIGWYDLRLDRKEDRNRLISSTTVRDIISTSVRSDIIA